MDHKWSWIGDHLLRPKPSTLISCSGRGTTRAKDAQGTPCQSHLSPSILAYEDYWIPTGEPSTAVHGVSCVATYGVSSMATYVVSSGLHRVDHSSPRRSANPRPSHLFESSHLFGLASHLFESFWSHASPPFRVNSSNSTSPKENTVLGSSCVIFVY